MPARWTPAAVSSSPSTTASAGWSVLTTSYTVTHTFCLTGEQLRDSLPRKAGIGEVIDTALRAAAPRRSPASSPLSRKYRALSFPGTAGPQLRPRRRRPSPSLTAATTAPNVPGRRRARLRPRRHRLSPTRHSSPPRSRYRGSSVTSPPATTQRAAPSRPRSAASQPRVLVPSALRRRAHALALCSGAILAVSSLANYPGV